MCFIVCSLTLRLCMYGHCRLTLVRSLHWFSVTHHLVVAGWIHHRCRTIGWNRIVHLRRKFRKLESVRLRWWHRRLWIRELLLLLHVLLVWLLHHVRSWVYRVRHSASRMTKNECTGWWHNCCRLRLIARLFGVVNCCVCCKCKSDHGSDKPQWGSHTTICDTYSLSPHDHSCNSNI